MTLIYKTTRVFQLLKKVKEGLARETRTKESNSFKFKNSKTYQKYC